MRDLNFMAFSLIHLHEQLGGQRVDTTRHGRQNKTSDLIAHTRALIH